MVSTLRFCPTFPLHELIYKNKMRVKTSVVNHALHGKLRTLLFWAWERSSFLIQINGNYFFALHHLDNERNLH